MKRTLTLSALLMAGAIPAMAADLPVKAPPPVMAPLPTWTGFYAGFNGGYSWGESSRELNFVTVTGAAIIPPGGVITSGGTELEGGLFGGQIGYNWQTSNWVFGFETDIQWANQRGSRTFLCNGLACLPGLTVLPPGVTRKAPRPRNVPYHSSLWSTTAPLPAPGGTRASAVLPAPSCHPGPAIQPTPRGQRKVLLPR